MDVSHLLDPLNDAQRQAVTAPLAPDAGARRRRQRQDARAHAPRRLAGAGRGRRRRTASSRSPSPTRPRARCARASSSCSACPSAPLWIGTFHGIAHRLLRLHWREAGPAAGLPILDAEDQQRLDQAHDPRRRSSTRRAGCRARCSWFINAQKDEGLRPKHLKDDGDPTRRQMIKLYEAYEDACRRNGVVDFAELLLRSLRAAARQRPGCVEHYRARFAPRAGRRVPGHQRHPVRLDEGCWSGPSGIPFVVGDDDQSIYRWRGARVENLQQFRRDFPGAQLFRLEQNYRSTGNILAAANALIANNTGRIGKNLWTDGGKGEPHPAVRAPTTSATRPSSSSSRIRDWVAQRRQRAATRRSCTARTRSRACSRSTCSPRAFRTACTAACGSSSAQEIKDALAYLRLIANRDDDASFERVVNLPTRGIGARTLEVLRAHAQGALASRCGSSAAPCAGASSAPRRHGLPAGVPRSSSTSSTRDTRDLPLHEQVDHVIQASGLVGHYRRTRPTRARRGSRTSRNW